MRYMRDAGLILLGLALAVGAYALAAVGSRGKRLSPQERPQRRRSTVRVALVLAVVFVLTFVVAMIVTFWRFQAVPDSLIENVLDFGKWEVWACAVISIAKMWRAGGKDPPVDAPDGAGEET